MVSVFKDFLTCETGFGLVQSFKGSVHYISFYFLIRESFQRYGKCLSFHVKNCFCSKDI